MVFEPKPVRCILVDDSRHFLTAAAGLLEHQDITVIATTRTGADTLRLIEELRPDVVVLDVHLGQENGFDLAERIHREIAGPPTLIMTSSHDEADFVDILAASPAAGFAPKSSLSAVTLTNLLGRLH